MFRVLFPYAVKETACCVRLQKQLIACTPAGTKQSRAQFNDNRYIELLINNSTSLPAQVGTC
jgi:hypothetical protein